MAKREPEDGQWNRERKDHNQFQFRERKRKRFNQPNDPVGEVKLFDDKGYGKVTVNQNGREELIAVVGNDVPVVRCPLCRGSGELVSTVNGPDFFLCPNCRGYGYRTKHQVWRPEVKQAVRFQANPTPRQRMAICEKCGNITADADSAAGGSGMQRDMNKQFGDIPSRKIALPSPEIERNVWNFRDSNSPRIGADRDDAKINSPREEAIRSLAFELDSCYEKLQSDVANFRDTSGTYRWIQGKMVKFLDPNRSTSGDVLMEMWEEAVRRVLLTKNNSEAQHLWLDKVEPASVVRSRLMRRMMESEQADDSRNFQQSPNDLRTDYPAPYYRRDNCSPPPQKSVLPIAFRSNFEWQSNLQ